MPEHEVFPPALAMAAIIKNKNLRPHLLVHPNCLPDLGVETSADDANCVILGDATDSFTYTNMNAAFRVLLNSGNLYALGKGKYYKEDGELTIDVGPYVAALEFATGREATVVGKPAKEFFHTALQDMGVEPSEAVMVGDDIVSDVGGAQAAGIQGVLVRTGKFTPADEKHATVKPDRIVDNLAQVVCEILEN
jgi:phospholysine phosphohistidine inorganic pyrophosphate phosphatase